MSNPNYTGTGVGSAYTAAAFNNRNNNAAGSAGKSSRARTVTSSESSSIGADSLLPVPSVTVNAINIRSAPTSAGNKKLSQSASADSLSSSLPARSPGLISSNSESTQPASAAALSHTPLRGPVRIVGVGGSVGTSTSTVTIPSLSASVSPNVSPGAPTPQQLLAFQQFHSITSPPTGVALAPPTERTRLLLEGNFSLANDSADDEDDNIHSTILYPCSNGIRQSSGGKYSSLSRGSSGDSNAVNSLGPTPSPPHEKETTTSTSVKNSRAYVAFILPVTVALTVGNSVTWKRTLNRFASVDGSQRNLEFFVNQWTLLLYTVIAGVILAYRWLFTNLITSDTYGTDPSYLHFPHARVIPNHIFLLSVHVPCFLISFV
jgi:hypothetical protein